MKLVINILLCALWSFFVYSLKLPLVPYLLLCFLGGFIIGLFVFTHGKDFE